METHNVTFTGKLYGKMGTRRTKGIVCCPHGDCKFIKFVNKIAEENPNALSIKGKDNEPPVLVVETKKIPKFSPMEMLIIRVDKLQKKALRLRKENKIQSFEYEFTKYDYINMRRRYPFISSETLDKFETNIKRLAPENLKEFFIKFFS